MGKYIRKCKILGQVAVMDVPQVGVRTRARSLAMAAAKSGTTKRRKVGGRKSKFSSSLIQLRNRRGVVVTRENSVSPVTSGNSRRRTASNEPCGSPSSDHVPSSCCSSNVSTEVAKDRFKFGDPQDERVEIETSTYNFNCRERRETTSSSELRTESNELESKEKPSEANSRPRATVEKMPSEAELEEFFSAAEKDLQKRFTEKYNYDIAKDVPLEGRYEWVRLKP